MKIAHKKTLGKKQKVLIVVILLLVAAGSIAVFYFYNTQRNSNTTANEPRPVNTVDYNPPTAEEEQSTSTQKDQIINDYNKDQSGETPTSSDIAVTISRANQTSAGLSIGTIIDGAKSGTCTVALSRSGQPTISKSFTIAYEATSGFCQEAVIPINDITSSGEWQLTVTATSGGKTSQPATQTVSISKP